MYIKNHKKNRFRVNFDLKDIKEVSIDAIMYLLAMIKNLQNIGFTRHGFYGNLPSNPSALEKFKESGFLDFVKSPLQVLSTNANKITIRTGKSNDSKVLKEICDFIIEKAGCTRVNTKFLYALMAEMMYNTYEHAYNDKSYTIKNWYIFVEFENDLIKVTFLDTGLGVPKTLRKRFKEILLSTPENQLVCSALDGELRSQTKLVYRNNGLPTIKEYAINKKILNLHLISNKAYCYIDGNLEMNSKELVNPIMGTLFYWEVNINSLKG